MSHTHHKILMIVNLFLTINNSNVNVMNTKSTKRKGDKYLLSDLMANIIAKKRIKQS